MVNNSSLNIYLHIFETTPPLKTVNSFQAARPIEAMKGLLSMFLKKWGDLPFEVHVHLYTKK